jgi:hypothetical protein
LGPFLEVISSTELEWENRIGRVQRGSGGVQLEVRVVTVECPVGEKILLSWVP